MIAFGEYVKAFTCWSDNLYIFRLDKMTERGVYTNYKSEELFFTWDCVEKLTGEELRILGLEG